MTLDAQRLLQSAKNAVRRAQLARVKRAGLRAGTDLRLNGMPNFGREPYLVTLGDHVQISGDVTFLTHDGAVWPLLPSDPVFADVHKFGRIVVGDNCFVGHGSIILPGVTIGANSIVAAGSVVTKDVLPGSVVGGNPARVITTLDDYAARALRCTPPVDLDAYERDKRAELTRVHPSPW